MDMKILQRESPFRLDVDFTEKISLAGYIGNLGEKNNGVENEEFFLNGLENIGPDKRRNLRDGYMKILKRESPFRLDVDFIEKIQSLTLE
jgi:hypothetical protein